MRCHSANNKGNKSINKQAELHTIKLGGRTIVLPAPEPSGGCRRCDYLGKMPRVAFSFRQRLLAFFTAEEATAEHPLRWRYYYVQCARFFAGINETRESYL